MLERSRQNKKGGLVIVDAPGQPALAAEFASRSYYAADASELAPRLLPRLDTWRDLFKSPISAADNRAIARPIFEVTLIWTRDANGKCFERPKEAMNPFQLVRPTCSP